VVDLDEPTWRDMRDLCDRISDHIGEWQGIPIPLGEDTPLVLCEGHPMHDLYRDLRATSGPSMELLIGGPSDVPPDEKIVNHWFDARRNREVYVLSGGGRHYALTAPRSPDRSMDRLTFWLHTLGAIDAWDLDAEHAARDTLRAMLSKRQWATYDLTGTFVETSPRSRITYLFRRLRPTVALSPRGRDGREDAMRCLAVLCLHPIGYYADTWAGAMVPSDDVIAHLAMMRGDEAFLWRKANQHEPASPEAGL
jgi:hypothetical protein